MLSRAQIVKLIRKHSGFRQAFKSMAAGGGLHFAVRPGETYPGWVRNKRGHGPSNANYKPGKIGAPGKGWDRAQYLYPNQLPCQWVIEGKRCGKQPTDRAHLDDNTLNNRPGNVAFLCRPHHMMQDGRTPTVVGGMATRR